MLTRDRLGLTQDACDMGGEEGEGGRENQIFIVKECLDLQDLFLPYSLPLPPELLGIDKLFSPKGVITDKGSLGNDLVAKWTQSIVKNRGLQNPLTPGLGSTSSSHRLGAGPERTSLFPFQGLSTTVRGMSIHPRMELRGGQVAPTPENPEEILAEFGSWTNFPPMSFQHSNLLWTWSPWKDF